MSKKRPADGATSGAPAKRARSPVPQATAAPEKGKFLNKYDKTYAHGLKISFRIYTSSGSLTILTH